MQTAGYWPHTHTRAHPPLTPAPQPNINKEYRSCAMSLNQTHTHARTRTRALYSHCLGPLQRVVMRLSRTRPCDISPLTLTHSFCLSQLRDVATTRCMCFAAFRFPLQCPPPPSTIHTLTQIHIRAFSPNLLYSSPLLSSLPSQRSPLSAPSAAARRQSSNRTTERDASPSSSAPRRGQAGGRERERPEEEE